MNDRDETLRQLKAERMALLERLAFLDRQPPLIAPASPGSGDRVGGAHLRALRAGLGRIEAEIAACERASA